MSDQPQRLTPRLPSPPGGSQLISRGLQRFCDLQNRRQFLRTSVGLGAYAAASVAPRLTARADDSAALPDGCHHPPKAKRVIFLFMAGAPSQLDLYDPKPNLEKLHGQALPAEVSMGQRVTAMTRGKKQEICASIFKFAPQGESGLEMCELLPHLSTVADELCIPCEGGPTCLTRPLHRG